MLTALILAAVLDGAVAPAAVATPEPRPARAADVLAAVAAARGKVVLLNVWATWCLPCREEMPDLLALRRELRGRGFELVLVSADFESEAAEAREFLGSLGVDFPTWRKSQRDQEFIDGVSSSWSGALPFTLVFDREGRPGASWEGGATLGTLRSKILPLLSRGEPLRGGAEDVPCTSSPSPRLRLGDSPLPPPNGAVIHPSEGSAHVRLAPSPTKGTAP